MKTTKIAALGLIGLTTLGLAATTAQAAPAAETESEGKVTFNTDMNALIQPPTKNDNIDNPGNSSGQAPGTEAPYGSPDLYISYVTDFDFGTVDYEMDDMTVYAQPYNYQPVTPQGGTKPAKIQDALGISIVNTDKVAKGWTLSAAATEFSKVGEGTDIIKGLTMTIPSMTPRQVISSAAANVIVTPEEDVVLGEDQPIVTYTQKNEKDPVMSITNIAFGTLPEAPANYKGVQLDIPANRTIEDGATYTSTITWTLNQTL